jgi:hypothetical protein
MIQTESKIILDSNSVLQFKDEDLFITLNLSENDSLTVQIIFKQVLNANPDELINIEGNLIKLTLINYAVDAGIGFEKPKKIFTFNDKDIYISIVASTLAVQVLGPINRLVHYSIYQDK